MAGPVHSIMMRATPNRLNRIATLATIPVLVFGVVLASRAREQTSTQVPASLVGEGLLVVANLQSSDLTIYRFGERDRMETLALPGPPHEFAVIDDRLYVTLGRANLLAEVDPFLPAILRTVDLPGAPHGIAVDGEGIHITLDGQDRVVTLDRSSLDVVHSQPTGVTPHAVAAGEGVLFITDSRDGRLRRIEAGAATTAAAGKLPEAIALRDGIVLVADAEGGAIHAFNSASLSSLGAVSLPGWPVRIVIAGDRVLVTLSRRATLSVLSFPDLDPVAEVPVGPFPDGICLSPSGRFAAVPSNGDGAITIVDVASWTAIGALDAGGGPGACAWIRGD